MVVITARRPARLVPVVIFVARFANRVGRLLQPRLHSLNELLGRAVVDICTLPFRSRVLDKKPGGVSLVNRRLFRGLCASATYVVEGEGDSGARWASRSRRDWRNGKHGIRCVTAPSVCTTEGKQPRSASHHLGAQRFAPLQSSVLHCFPSAHSSLLTAGFHPLQAVPVERVPVSRHVSPLGPPIHERTFASPRPRTTNHARCSPAKLHRRIRESYTILGMINKWLERG
jgi:hypothetical protein